MSRDDASDNNLIQDSLFSSSDSQNYFSKPAIALPRFPTTRFQGSKRKILPALFGSLLEIDFDSSLDLFSGSGMVTLLLRQMGKKVDSNDAQLFNVNTAKLFSNISTEELISIDTSKLRDLLHSEPSNNKSYVAGHYKEIFFKHDENTQIDNFAQNLVHLNETERMVFIYAVGQSLLKKRPYNLFHRSNLSMRTKEVERSFGNAVTWETPIEVHAINAINELRKFPFNPNINRNSVFSQNTCDLEPLKNTYDLVYLDPPYINSKGLGVDYSDFYGFLEGLCNYELFAQGDPNYPHKPILKKTSNWLNPVNALNELEQISNKWKRSILFLSYRSDGLPTLEKMSNLLKSCGRKVSIHSAGEYKYALSKNSYNEEIFLIAE